MKKFFQLSFTLITLIINAQIPTGYYDSAAGFTGATLKSKLSTIITNGHSDHGYAALWTAYNTTDRDKTYENDNTILDIYSELPNSTSTNNDPYNFAYSTNQCGTYSSEGDCYNREHIVPQSLFNQSSPMVSDIHFIRPTDGKVNGMRSNYPFGKVGSVSYTSANGSKLGTSASPNYSGTVFEPIDEFKGDVARMIFYFVTRYETKLSTFTSGDILGSSAFPGITDWELAVLISWHNADPVSQAEIIRNDASYTFQGNRNPFIDHPEYVNSIWGTPVADTEAPSVPTNITESNKTSTSATLSWSASTDNVAVTGYNIYKDGVLVGTSSSNTYNITGLTAATSYQITIEAFDAAGNKSALSTAYTLTTPLGNPPGDSEELYISEYYEGLSNNKVIEITNSSGAAISLNNYSIKKQSNGAGSWVNELVLSGTLNPNSTLVLKNSLTSLTCNFTAQSVTGAPLDFNGNDPIGLFKSGILIDIVGTFNGGTANFAADTNLRRKFSTPNTTYTPSEWDSFTVTSTSLNCDNIGIVNPSGTLSVSSNTINDIKIYPNPVKNGEIFFTGNNLQNIKSVEIYSYEGKLIKKILNPFIKNKSISIKELPKGIYFIKTDNSIQKIIKE